VKPKAVAILGTGLIGASVGLALRRRNKRAYAIIGWDPSLRNAGAARRRRAIDAASPTLERAIESADIIVLAAPLAKIGALIPRSIKGAKPGALILDVGGLKETVAAIAAAALRERHDVMFVAGHPMAGNERSGPQAASTDLFEDRQFAIYAPPQNNRARAWRAAQALVGALGSRPVRISPREHDRLVAATSALPQLAALAIARAADRASGKRAKHLAGPAIEGATRLADSPFTVWEIALMQNKRNVRRALRALEHEIGTIGAALERGDARGLAKIFVAAAAARRRICSTPRRTSATRSS